MIFLDVLLMAESRQDLECQSQEVLAPFRLLGFGKVPATPNAQVGVFGPHNRHNAHDNDLTGGEGVDGVPISSSQEQSVSEGLVATNRHDVANNTGSTTENTTQSFETMVLLNEESKGELEWWIAMLNRRNGCPILPLALDLII